MLWDGFPYEVIRHSLVAEGVWAMVREGDDDSGKGLFVVVVGSDTVGAWVLFVMAILGWVGVWMEIVGGEHRGHSQEGRG